MTPIPRAASAPRQARLHLYVATRAAPPSPPPSPCRSPAPPASWGPPASWNCLSSPEPQRGPEQFDLFLFSLFLPSPWNLLRCRHSTHSVAALPPAPSRTLDLPTPADKVMSLAVTSAPQFDDPGAIVKWDHATMAWLNSGFESPWLQ